MVSDKVRKLARVVDSLIEGDELTYVVDNPVKGDKVVEQSHELFEKPWNEVQRAHEVEQRQERSRHQ